MKSEAVKTMNTLQVQEQMAIERVGEAIGPVLAYEQTIDALDIADEDSNAQMGDIVKKVRSLRIKWDEERKSYTAPLRNVVERINEQFNPLIKRLDSCEAAAKKKMKLYAHIKVAEAEERRKREIEERRAAEEAALALAEKAEKYDDAELTQSVIDKAIANTEKAQKAAVLTPSRSEESTTSVVRRWAAEVVSVKEVCAAVARGDLPLELVSVSQAKINDLALMLKEEKTANGIRYYQDISVSVR